MNVDLAQIFDLIDGKPPQPHQYAVIILNTPPNSSMSYSFARQSAYTIMTDGAANHLDVSQFDCAKTIVIGDMDSIRGEVKDKLGAMVVHDQRQDTTDFEKAINYIQDNRPDIQLIYCLGSLGGRYDHTLYNISMTYRQGPAIILIDECNIIFTMNTCNIRSVQRVSTVGLMPLKEPVRIRTQNLFWDVDSVLTYGVFTSCSNYIADKEKDVNMSCYGENKLMTVILTYE